MLFDPRSDPDMIRNHHASIGITAGLINMTSAYLTAEVNSPEEVLGEQELSDAMHRASNLPQETIGNVLLGLCSLICAVAEPDDVQGWFDHQSRMIAEAME